MASPSKRIAPLVGRRSPAAIFAAVVLPDPLSPTRQSTWPGCRLSDTASTASSSPRLTRKTWLALSSAISGSAIALAHHGMLEPDLWPVVTCHLMPFGHCRKRGLLLWAAIAGIRAAGMERAAGREQQQARRRARDRRDLGEITDHRWHRLDQTDRVRVARVIEDVPHGALLDDTAGVHRRHA